MKKLLAGTTICLVALAGCNSSTMRLDGQIVTAKVLDDSRVAITYKVENAGTKEATPICSVRLDDKNGKQLATEQFPGEKPLAPGDSEQIKVVVKIKGKNAAAVSQTTVECNPA